MAGSSPCAPGPAPASPYGPRSLDRVWRSDPSPDRAGHRRPSFRRGWVVRQRGCDRAPGTPWTPVLRPPYRGRLLDAGATPSSAPTSADPALRSAAHRRRGCSTRCPSRLRRLEHLLTHRTDPARRRPVCTAMRVAEEVPSARVMDLIVKQVTRPTVRVRAIAEVVRCHAAEVTRERGACQ